MADAPCPFCDFDDGEVVIYQDRYVRAVVAKQPIHDYHVLIVPRVHAERLPDLPPEHAAAAIHAAQRVVRAILRAAAPDGITYITEDDITGQGYNLVAHWKLHIVPRYKEDGVQLKWARRTDPGPEARAEIATVLQAHLPADH